MLGKWILYKTQSHEHTTWFTLEITHSFCEPKILLVSEKKKLIHLAFLQLEKLLYFYYVTINNNIFKSKSKKNFSLSVKFKTEISLI